MDPQNILRRAIRLIIREEATQALSSRWSIAPLTTALAGEWGTHNDEEEAAAEEEAEEEAPDAFNK